MYRLLQRIWRLLVDEETGALTGRRRAADDETRRLLHRTIDAVRDGMEDLRFNISIAKLTELNNHLTATRRSSRRHPARSPSRWC